MARPQKSGLEYFPLDVDIDNDEKVAYVISRYGFQAFGLLIKILMNIYHDGYYMMWTERQQYLFSFKLNVDSELAKTIVSAYINEGFFDRNIYEKYGVLTSHGIQTRYLQAVGRRSQVRIAREYCLFSPEECSKIANVDYYSVNVSNNSVIVNNNHAETYKNQAKSTQSKVKESNISTTTTARTCEDDMVDKELAKIIQAYSDNIHPVTPMEFEDISSWMEDYGFSSELIIKAIGRAVDAGKRSKGYVKGILRSWKENGLDDPGDKKGGRQYGRNRGNDSRNRSKKERDDKYADFEEADRRQVHPWDLPADGDGAGAEPGKDT